MINREGRIKARFESLAEKKLAGLITFITAGDPDQKSSEDILMGLPHAGADLIEIGMPFTDPMADGPAIQLSSKRALASGQNMDKTLKMVEKCRKQDADTPIILMGYYNPIYSYGAERFSVSAANVGVDGLIIVDLPPEEEEELVQPAIKAGIDFVRLTTPTSDKKRLLKLVKTASGFIYHISITGITGTQSAETLDIRNAVGKIREQSNLPIAVGFGIRTPAQAAEIASIADAAVVGSAIVEKIADGIGSPDCVNNVLQYVSEMANGVHTARMN